MVYESESRPSLECFGPAVDAMVLGLLEGFYKFFQGVQVGVSQFAQVCFSFSLFF